jgi:hypothetical protein
LVKGAEFNTLYTQVPQMETINTKLGSNPKSTYAYCTVKALTYFVLNDFILILNQWGIVGNFVI